MLGRMKNGVVVFENDAGASLPEDTLVEVTPVKVAGAVQENADSATKPATTKKDPFADALPVTKERREALLSLIGMCKMENPPSDEEVKQIIDEYRMKKYG
jgi:hypothetical protein